MLGHFKHISLAAAAMVASFAPASNAQDDLSDGLYAEIDTDKGNILLQLEFEKTPLTVANFVGLAEGIKASNKPKGERFYDGLIFHRVVSDFMIQGGCPEGTGRGGPGYRFPDEIHPDLKHSGPGVLSMANAGPGTNGSQFFITHVATPHLDGKHTVFGRVVSGQDAVNAIEKGDAMKSVTIKRIGAKAEAFQADQEAWDTLRAHQIKDPAEANLESAEAYLAETKAREGVRSTESGLLYEILEEGEGASPTKSDRVKVHYTGTLVDGKVFDSSVKRGEPATFPLERVIPGWIEGLGLMKKGGKAILHVHPNMAYGERGYPGVIPPNSVLVFEVELLDINP